MIVRAVLSLVLLAATGCTASTAQPRALPTPTPVRTTAQAPAGCPLGAPLRPGAVVSVIGDSYTTLGGPDRWPDQLARRTGWTVHVDGQEGSGYMVGGYTGKDFSGPRFPDQVAKLKPQQPDLVIVLGSRNDIRHTDDPYPMVVNDTLRAIRAAVPLTPLLVFGSYWVDAHAPDALLYIHEVLREATGLIPCSTFVDPVKEGWFDAPAGLIGPDGEHPTTKGLTVVTDRVQQDLTRLGYLS